MYSSTSSLILLISAAASVMAADSEVFCKDFSKACKNIPLPDGFSANAAGCTSYTRDLQYGYPSIYGVCEICPTGSTAFDDKCTLKTIKKADGITFWKRNATNAEIDDLSTALTRNCMSSSQCFGNRTMSITYRDADVLLNFNIRQWGAQATSSARDPNKVFWYAAGTCGCNAVTSNGVEAPRVKFTVPKFEQAEMVDGGLVIAPAGNRDAATATFSKAVTGTKPNGAASSVGNLWVGAFSILFVSVLSL
ncbi:hypothetical protein HDU97_001716 [Phlyctochytrium planicorne]|nr:hypothetical protein HDU97_001716 [Phlyctochytrium planicorne]